MFLSDLYSREDFKIGSKTTNWCYCFITEAKFTVANIIAINQ